MSAKRVWKFEVPVDDQEHMVPWPIVHVSAKDERVLYVWAEVDPAAPRTMPVRVYATGQPLPADGIHCATVGIWPFVWHLYKIVPVND